MAFPEVNLREGHDFQLLLALSQRVQGAGPAAGGQSGGFGGQGKVPRVGCGGPKRKFEILKIFGFLQNFQILEFWPGGRSGRGGAGHVRGGGGAGHVRGEGLPDLFEFLPIFPIW